MKTTVRLSVRGTSLQALIDEARKRLDELHAAADWTIDELETYCGDEVPDEDNGFVTVWSGSITATTTVEL